MSKWTASRWVEYGTKEDNYEWTQTPDDVTLTFKVPAATKAKDIEVIFKPHHLKITIKPSATALIEGDLCRQINVEESTWTKNGDVIEVILCKGTDSQGDEENQWWSCAIKGHKEVDVKAMASTRFLDESLLKRIWEDKHNPQQTQEQQQPSAEQPSTSAPTTTTPETH